MNAVPWPISVMYTTFRRMRESDTLVVDYDKLRRALKSDETHQIIQTFRYK